MRNRTTLLCLTLLIAASHFAIIAGYANPETDPRFLQIELTGLRASIPLRDTLFSTMLVGQGNYTVISHDSIGPFEAGSIISAIARHVLSPNEQNLAFYANLSAHDVAIFQVEGTLDIEKMVSGLTVLRIDSTALKSTNSTSLKFTSIGIVGSIRIEILPKTNAQLLKATLLWKNQTFDQDAHNASNPFTFEDLRSNSPEVPFEVNITNKDVGNIVFAIGTLKVDSERVSMPFTINYWNPNLIAGWNITFTSAQYARESTLPIVVSGESSELANPPGAYTADFRENATSGSEQPTGKPDQTDWFQTIYAALSTPTSLAVITILAVATATIVIYKVRRHRIKST